MLYFILQLVISWDVKVVWLFRQIPWGLLVRRDDKDYELDSDSNIWKNNIYFLI